MKASRSTANFLRFALGAASLLPALAWANGATWTEPRTGMAFTRMAKGCYAMGVADDQPAREEGYIYARRVANEMPAHEVCLDEFWIGRFEVTEAQWQTLIGTPRRPVGPGHPVTGISWQEAQTFARRLSEISDKGDQFRLPTEAEWEYACRAGEPASSGPPYTDEIAGKAWFSFHYEKKTGERHASVHPVGTRQANAAGLHDMLGNAWEWVQDSYRDDAYRLHARRNPVIEQDGAARAIRGGGFRTARHFIRCAARAWQDGATQTDTIGFRLVRIPRGEK
ncbi:formylglycine-generating enzyme family protein [Dechloromonas sp. A34]|uniref:formylglycine-generating enzyme family protein n=1 Tax=Dechloromonas sp. A34 TaxID=447588 RepID=UPI002249A004|nr:SUMF1/EgtB/PvdO family nonheme iron enzyme [Dechloromonas sp. A34]